jgi:hypothetical protein
MGINADKLPRMGTDHIMEMVQIAVDLMASQEACLIVMGVSMNMAIQDIGGIQRRTAYFLGLLD